MPIPLENDVRLDVARVQEKFADALIKVKHDRGDTFLCVKADRIADIVAYLKDDADLAYDYFVECLGVDYSTWKFERDLEGRFEVVYNLFSTKHSQRLFLEVAVHEGEKIPTLKNLFLGAEYPEREVWDLFGVVFAGNEQDERFLLPDDWIGHPLRKEVPLGGEDVVFHDQVRGPAVEDVMMPHAGESFEGKTGSDEISGR